MGKQVEVFYSPQSDYCFFLLGRLIALANSGVDVIIRPVPGVLVRISERYSDQFDQLKWRLEQGV